MADRHLLEPTVEAKVMLAGPLASGKSLLLASLLHGGPVPLRLAPTIGVAMEQAHTVRADGVRLRLQLWDESGSPRYTHLLHGYELGCHAVLFCFDAASAASWAECQRAVAAFEARNRHTWVGALVANELVAPPMPALASAAQRFSAERGWAFHECAPLRGRNVAPLFEALAQSLVRRARAQQTDDTLAPLLLQLPPAAPPSPCCCAVL